MLYETLLKKLKQRRALSNSNKGVTALEIFLLGALAKLGAAVLTYPLLVLKSRFKARQAIGLDKKHQYEGTLDVIMKMIRYEGLHGFYKGMSTKIVQSVLVVAVLFMVKEVNDLQSIQKLGINPHDIARLVTRTFAEMMFKHGFVHCDPHAANLLVRTLPSSKRGIFGRRKPQLVLLDHGLYKVIDNSIRTDYAALWKDLVLADANGIKENCLTLGACEDLYALFAGILTMRPWNRVIDPAVDHLAIQGNASDHSELQMYASLYFPQITELLHKLPRVILIMLKTNDCLRSVNNALIKYPPWSLSLLSEEFLQRH